MLSFLRASSEITQQKVAATVERASKRILIYRVIDHAVSVKVLSVSKNADRSQETHEGSPLVQHTVEGRARHQAALAVVVALLAITVIDTSFIDTLRPSLSRSAASYERTRRDVGFGGVPMEAVAEAIDRRLPPEEAVSLAPSVANNALLLQRFCEGLYPRRISTTAQHQVTVDAAAAGIPLAGTAKLLGPAVEAKLVPRFYSVSRDLGRALLLTLSVLGWGLLVMAGLRKLRRTQGFLHGIAPSLFLPVALL
ncbi:MAG TPA: hypothetical protein VF550_12945, partial [Polyangia bacterium]